MTSRTSLNINGEISTLFIRVNTSTVRKIMMIENDRLEPEEI